MRCATKQVLFFVILLLTLSACAGATPASPAVQPDEEVIPTPASEALGRFVWQTDGLFGYRMLRPAEWTSVNLVGTRGYRPPGSGAADTILLRAANLQAQADSTNTGTSVNATLALFERDPSLEGWTTGVEQLWESNGITFTLLHTLPQARIYSVESPGASNVQIVAYAVGQDQPLAIDLTASGAYAEMERLEQEGILDDFVAMVASVEAIPRDPANVDPPLE